jgi:ATP/maltotriose-dependent transcriptional regulator MalT
LCDAEEILAGLEPLPWARAMLAFVSGRRAFLENRYQDAEEALCASASLLDAVGGEAHSSFAYRYMGRLAAVRGDYNASVQAITTALRLARDLGLSAFAHVLLTDLAASLAAKGEFELARRALDEPLASARDQRHATGVRQATTALAWVEWRANNIAEAVRLASSALRPGRSSESGETAVHCSVILGLASQRRGEVAHARACHRDALEMARRTGDPRLVALALEGLAAAVLCDRDGGEAAKLLGAAASLRRSLGQATGWGFASIAPVDADEAMARAGEMIGTEPAAAAFSGGAENPVSVVANAL